VVFRRTELACGEECTFITGSALSQQPSASKQANDNDAYLMVVDVPEGIIKRIFYHSRPSRLLEENNRPSYGA